MEPETIEPTNQIASEQDAGSPVDTTETCTTAEPQVPAGERRNGSIRRRLAYLVIACVLPVWIAAGFLLGRDYLSRRALTEQRMLETARSLTIVVDRELGAMQASLRALSNANSLQRGDLAAFDARARMVMEANPGADIILSNADGQQLVNTFRPFGTPLPKRNVADAVRQIYSTEMPVITNVYKGALTGRFVISVDVPVFRDGRVVYDLAMSVPADRFAAVLLQQQLPSGWIGRIYGSNQMMVARFPSAEKFTGRRANTVLGQRMREKAEGMVETINSDGIPMFNSFDRSVASGWTVAIGVPKAIMMAEIWRWLRWALAGTVLLSLSGIALALPLGRSIEQIERAQRLLAAIVESSDDAIYSKNLDGIITTWNKGAERLYGYTAAEAVGRSVSLIVPPEHLEELHDVLQDVRCGEPVERHETVRMHKDGRRVHVTVALAPVKDKRGEVTGSSVVAHDITRRKHAEKRIAHLASFPELNPAPVFESDLDGNVTYANLAAVRIFPDLIQSGLTHALLRKWSSVVELFKTGNERQIVREIEADGSQFLQTIHYTPDLGVIRAYLLDISERQLAEKALTESEERLRTIVELAPEGIFVIGEQGRILQVNQATCDQLGRTRSQLLHLALSDIVAPRFAHRIATLLRGEVPPGPYESAHIRADGSEVPVELSVTKITFREQPAILGIARDISDRRRTEEERAELEQQLRQAQKMEAVGKLAGGVAHDFNNILMVIQSYTEMLQDCLPPHDALRRNTQQVLKASERAASLTRQMLAFSRKQILSPVVLDLNAVIEETAIGVSP
jgi:PAS domain S-box-containing protein